MKKILLSGLFVLIAFLSNSQCLETFNAKNNGAGSSTFPGFGSVGDNNYQAPDANYGISGTVEVSFSSALPTGTPAPAILTVNQTSPSSKSYNYKFSNAIISADRRSAIYNFYSPTSNQNLPNGSMARYTITLQYLGQPVSTCLEVKNIPPVQPLPVRFASFSASRTSASRVSISWTTASEQNNRGFNVQKNVNGEWKTIAFVFSLTDDGNSTSALNYSFTDPNAEKGITQYRIQQVDLDGRFAYSDIRAIRGEAIEGKIVVYPNPSVDGKVNVVFEDNLGQHDVQVNDMQGRIVQSFKGITNNILVIEKLTSGFYTIKITNRTTTASSVQKVVIK